MAEIRHTAIKYRIYPTCGQRVLFQKTFGCCRFVYNTMLTIQEELYSRNRFHLSKYDAFKLMTSELKSGCDFLREVDSLALMNSVFALSEAYGRFFKGLADKPVYKSRKSSRLSYTTNNQNGTVAVSDRYIKLPKAGKIRAKIHRTINHAKIKQATVSYDRNGKYYCSVLFEYESDVKPVQCESVEDVVGLDFNEAKLYVDNYGNSPTKEYDDKAMDVRIKKQQRKLSHMMESHITGYKNVKGNRVPVYDKPLSECKNIQKQRRRIAKTQGKQANRRKDFLHKTSNQITNDYSLICIEDLSVKEMMLNRDTESSAIKRHNVNRKTLSHGWYDFTIMLEYKAQCKGKTLIKVPKDFASSQICHCCGYVNEEIKNLHIRKWKCPVCNANHNRDINAAINIRNKGYAMYMST